MNMLEMCTLMTGLGINSVIDIRTHKVSLKIMVVLFCAGCAFRMLQGNFFALSFFAALLPGIGFLLLSWLTRGNIGAGDGCMILVLGAFMDLEEVFAVCTIAISAVGIFGLFLMLGFHKSKNYEIPFFPFLFLGCLLTKIVYGG